MRCDCAQGVVAQGCQLLLVKNYNCYCRLSARAARVKITISDIRSVPNYCDIFTVRIKFTNVNNTTWRAAVWICLSKCVFFFGGTEG